MNVVPEARHAMTNGHSSLQLGVGGGAHSAPQQSQGRALMGAQGAKLPETLEILQFTFAKYAQKYTLVVHFL